MRYIQAAVSNEDHKVFTKFAAAHEMTLQQLLEAALKEYIVRTKRKEELDEVMKRR